MTYLLTIILTIVFVVCFILNFYKKTRNKFQILENNPSLLTKDYAQHVRRLNIFRTSNYKGTTYYFSKKGALYYYSKDNVRIYI